MEEIEVQETPNKPKNLEAIDQLYCSLKTKMKDNNKESFISEINEFSSSKSNRELIIEVKKNLKNVIDHGKMDFL